MGACAANYRKHRGISSFTLQWSMVQLLLYCELVAKTKNRPLIQQTMSILSRSKKNNKPAKKTNKTNYKSIYSFSAHVIPFFVVFVVLLLPSLSFLRRRPPPRPCRHRCVWRYSRRRQQSPRGVDTQSTCMLVSHRPRCVDNLPCLAIPSSFPLLLSRLFSFLSSFSSPLFICRSSPRTEWPIIHCVLYKNLS